MEVKRHPKANIFDFDLETQKLNDQIVCKNVAQILENHYPGWEWAVGVEQGMVRIHSFKLSMRYGFRIPIDAIDTEYSCIKLAGGEILERYSMPRGRYDHNQFMQRANFRISATGFEVEGDVTKTAPQRIII